MVSAASAEDLEFYDSNSQSVPKSLMDESGSDINVSTREIRRVLKRHTAHENAQYPEDSDTAAATPGGAAESADSGTAAAPSGQRAAAGSGNHPKTTGAAGAPAAGSFKFAVLKENTPSALRDPVNSVPKLLSDADVRHYRQIFHHQRKRRWQRADKLIKKLSDRSLLGHVYYQRYLHPTGYRASYKELRNWMVKYRDHPGARRIYKLATQRRPRNHLRPPAPKRVRSKAAPRRHYRDRYENRRKYYSLSSWKRRYVRQTQRRVRRYIERSQPTRALRLLTTKKTRRIFDPVSLDESRTDVARGYYHAGNSQKTLELAGPAALRSGRAIPLAHWWAGLAAWQLGKYDVAASHFDYMTQTKLRSSWSRASAAYWAARAYLVSHQPDKVNAMLQLAAQNPRTFYGLLAIRSLGTEPSYDWSLPPVRDDQWRTLEHHPHARRAMALIQVGEESRAENELRRLSDRLPQNTARILVALASGQNMPSLALRIGRNLRDRSGEVYDAALYPLPDWEPANGFTIDRALVFAVMRQESRFRIRAKSRAGARGLMQLMPRTAGFMAGKRFRGSRRHQLFNPELNITLGQKYVRHLLNDPNIDGDLFYAVAAYNGGPGNLRKWRRRSDYGGDPLLFIESIPLKETRIYVERVLTNLWIYRYRLGQPAPSLDAIATGEWPSYIALDDKSIKHTTNMATGL
ncbi:MAG: lytic transglycosylase domain-containing protein [Alphaproteobacteria bacterium]|nr:lytic transglycosylase domain-containing protein [Alphaproteobacteria bacterium]